MRRAVAWWALSILWSALPATAGHGPDWTVLTVKAAYVHRLLEGGQKVVPIDLRPVEEYQKGHLPGAHSFPLSELRDKFQGIPKTGLVVLYCACPPEEIQRAYLFLREQSYRNLTVMDDGFAAWAMRGYPLER